MLDCILLFPIFVTLVRPYFCDLGSTASSVDCLLKYIVFRLMILFRVNIFTNL